MIGIISAAHYQVANGIIIIKSTIWWLILSSTSFMVGRSRVLYLFLMKAVGR